MNASLRHVLAALPLLIAACAETPDAALDELASAGELTSPDALDQAPPPAPLPAGVAAFVVGEISPGGSLRVTWADLPPGAQVQIYATTRGAGPGPCPARFGGDCLDISGPVSMVAYGQANRAGILSGYVSIPTSATAPTYTFQAVAYKPALGYIFSDVYERSSGPQMCPFLYAPVCGVDRRIYDNDCMAEVAGTAVRAYGSCP